ncbi:MAG: hypothetical protein GX369_07505 [Euryarchaeota archaeon]|nr:hypothetical protein [Euryarchaeota archaeon]
MAIIGPKHNIFTIRTISRLKKDREGVASAIGAILAILVFISFMGIIVSSYMPAWMTDNEREHMDQSTGQFIGLKAKIDDMIMAKKMSSNTLSKAYVSIDLGSSGVPLLASPTAGVLKVTANSAISEEDFHGSGNIELYCPNRYYVQQWLAYENGAIILKQEDGEIMLAGPNLSFSKIDEGVVVRVTQIDIEGAEIITSGTNPIGLAIELIDLDYQSDDSIDQWELKINTEYGQAWETYLIDLLNRSEMEEGDHSDYTMKLDRDSGVTSITLIIHSVKELDMSRAIVSVQI